MDLVSMGIAQREESVRRSDNNPPTNFFRSKKKQKAPCFYRLPFIILDFDRVKSPKRNQKDIYYSIILVDELYLRFSSI